MNKHGCGKRRQPIPVDDFIRINKLNLTGFLKQDLVLRGTIKPTKIIPIGD